MEVRKELKQATTEVKQLTRALKDAKTVLEAKTLKFESLPTQKKKQRQESLARLRTEADAFIRFHVRFRRFQQWRHATRRDLWRAVLQRSGSSFPVPNEYSWNHSSTAQYLHARQQWWHEEDLIVGESKFVETVSLALSTTKQVASLVLFYLVDPGAVEEVRFLKDRLDWMCTGGLVFSEKSSAGGCRFQLRDFVTTHHLRLSFFTSSSSSSSSPSSSSSSSSSGVSKVSTYYKAEEEQEEQEQDEEEKKRAKGVTRFSVCYSHLDPRHDPKTNLFYVDVPVDYSLEQLQESAHPSNRQSNPIYRAWMKDSWIYYARYISDRATEICVTVTHEELQQVNSALSRATCLLDVIHTATSAACERDEIIIANMGPPFVQSDKPLANLLVFSETGFVEEEDEPEYNDVPCQSLRLLQYHPHCNALLLTLFLSRSKKEFECIAEPCSSESRRKKRVLETPENGNEKSQKVDEADVSYFLT